MMNCNYGSERKKDFYYHTKKHDRTPAVKEQNHLTVNAEGSHKRPKRQNRESLQCDKWDYKTRKESNFRMHIKKNHVDQKHFCEACNFSGSSLVKLEEHRKEVLELKTEKEQKSNPKPKKLIIQSKASRL